MTGLFYISPTVVILVVCFATVLHGLRIQTLEECERDGLQFCYTGPSENRHAINEAIKSSIFLQKEFSAIRPAINELSYWIRREKRSNMRKENDCSSVCCAIIEDTPPYSYIRDNDGWQEVATTPENPQRTVFRVEKCHTAASPCRGVEPLNNAKTAQCVQQTRTHKLYIHTNGTLHSRSIELPAGCKCKLMNKTPPRGLLGVRQRPPFP